MATDEGSAINIASRIKQFSSASPQSQQQQLDGKPNAVPHKKPSPVPRRRPQTTEVSYGVNNNNNNNNDNINNNNNNKPAFDRKAVNRTTSSPVRPRKPVIPVKPVAADRKSPLPSPRPVNNNKDSNVFSSYNGNNNNTNTINNTTSNNNSSNSVVKGNDKNRRTSTGGVKPAIPAKPTSIPPPTTNNKTKTNVNINTNKSMVVPQKPQVNTANKTDNSTNNNNSIQLSTPGASVPTREKSWKQTAGPPRVALPSGPANVARKGIIGMSNSDNSSQYQNDNNDVNDSRKINDNSPLRGSNSATLSSVIIPGSSTENHKTNNSSNNIEEYANQRILESKTDEQVPPKPLRGQQRFEVYETTNPNDPSSGKIVSNRSQCRRETLDGQMILGGAPMLEVSVSTSSRPSSSCKFLFIFIIFFYYCCLICANNHRNQKWLFNFIDSLCEVFYYLESFLRILLYKKWVKRKFIRKFILYKHRQSL